MDTDHCPKCNSKAVVAGSFPQMRGWGDKSFEPDDLRSFHFRWKQGVSCLEPFRACLACGLVLDAPATGRPPHFLNKYGNAFAKLDLSPFRKGPPEPDLV